MTEDQIMGSFLRKLDVRKKELYQSSCELGHKISTLEKHLQNANTEKSVIDARLHELGCVSKWVGDAEESQ